MTTVEMPRLLAAIETEDDDYARHALWLLLLTGLRLSEVLRSKWSDIDWDFRTLFIGLTKNGEPVLAPLSDAAMARLQQIPRLSNNEYIICGKKPGAHLVGLPHIWLRVRSTANLPDVRLHDLRRTVGSWLVQRGESLHLVGQILNHRDTKTTAGYAYFQTPHRERALTAHGQALMKFAPVSSSTSIALAYEAPVSRHMPASGGKDPARCAHYVSRENLYRLVWEAPVSEVAGRFGISDVGLAKACRRAAIPIPPRGYWAKAEAGRFVEQSPLPAPPPGLRDKIRLKGRASKAKQEDSQTVVAKIAA